jgi:HEAT repeat protein
MGRIPGAGWIFEILSCNSAGGAARLCATIPLTTQGSMLRMPIVLGRTLKSHAAPACACLLGLSLLATARAAPAVSRDLTPKIQRDVISAFQNGEYERVILFLETLPSDQVPSREILKVGTLSYVRLGRAEQALKTYTRLTPEGRSDELGLLRQVAKGFITSRVRDVAEHVRITAYTALAEIADPDTLTLFEDGLLDSSILVRARAVEGLGRTPQAIKGTRRPAPTALKRALQDRAPSVRIAALNALGDLGEMSAIDMIAGIARAEDGPVQVFALGALVKLGRADAASDVHGAATLPDPDMRMAAVGVLGRLKNPSSLRVLNQAVYDPDPAVRAFAAGALGEFGDPEGAAPLMHAIGDEHPRVRSMAAMSLGRLKAAHTRPILWQVARDPVELVRAGAVEGLLRLGDSEATLVAADLAKHPDPSVRGAAAQALGSTHDKRVLPVLDRLRQDLQPQPRLMAARALGKIGGQEAIRLLKKSLLDADPAVRTAAAGSLVQVLSNREAQSTR